MPESFLVCSVLVDETVEYAGLIRNVVYNHNMLLASGMVWLYWQGNYIGLLVAINMWCCIDSYMEVTYLIVLKMWLSIRLKIFTDLFTWKFLYIMYFQYMTFIATY